MQLESFPGCEESSRLITNITKGLQRVACNWFEVATLLGIPVNKLNSIKEDCDYSTEACLKGAVKVYLMNKGWVWGGGEGSCEMAVVAWLCLGKSVVYVYGWYCVKY